MKPAYTIYALRGRETKKLSCDTAWVAFEQHNRLLRQGWKVRTVSHAGTFVTDSQLRAAAQTELDGQATESKPG